MLKTPQHDTLAADAGSYVRAIASFATATGWSLCLMMLGFRALEVAGDPASTVRVGLGIAALAASNFVFMDTVASRAASPVSAKGRRVAAAITVTMGMVSIGCLVGAAAFWLARPVM